MGARMSMKRRDRAASLGASFAPLENVDLEAPVPHLKAGPVATVGDTFGRLKAELSSAQALLMAKGERIEEIDPTLIDASFARDRMAAFDPDGADAEFVAAIRDEGQLVPALLRPNPTAPGRYQPAYGRRRIAAAMHLGRKVRVVVRDLTDEQLVVAQGQENEARNGLTFIEKCRFAATLEAQGFKRKVVESALNVGQSSLSRMLQVVEKIPGEVIDWIGPAPGVGRPRWLKLADLSNDKNVRARIASSTSSGFMLPGINSSDERFNTAMAAATEPIAPKPTSTLWSLPGREKPYGSLEITPRRVNLSIDRLANPAFAEALLERLETIRRELESATATRSTKKG